jgi:photosystem II stability/assembly factor-like uncharacterized protein
LSASGIEGWAVGENSALLHLSNGVWSLAATSPGQYLRGVSLKASGAEGWAAGDATFLHLSGGVWSSANTPTDQYITAIALNTANNEGWAVTDKGTLLHFSDSGWSVVSGISGQPAITARYLYGVALSASGTEGWAVGEGTLVHLVGSHWDRINGA